MGLDLIDWRSIVEANLIDLNHYAVKTTLKTLLQDKTTKKNSIWATTSYADKGPEYQDTKQIQIGTLIGLNPIELQPRILKSLEEQQSRTIPSFLMAYGDMDVTLETFDTIIPDNVFKEVTSITLDEFRFLRDGGDYTDEDGNTKHFNGNIFDAMVFNDSITEFVELKDKLADYFDESIPEDIFDYIPPQKTNQIFTPKKIVKQMVDLLEQENPGCFDDPDKTFIDLYMKSGLYVTEIVKKLYNSPKLIELYPDSEARLKHIFAKQVYGLAPTEIIYQIVLSFVFGFDHKHSIIKEHNLRYLDALPYVEAGTLSEKLDELFGGNNNA